MDREKLTLTFFHEAHKVHLHMNYDTIMWKLIPNKMQTKYRRENEKK